LECLTRGFVGLVQIATRAAIRGAQGALVWLLDFYARFGGCFAPYFKLGRSFCYNADWFNGLFGALPWVCELGHLGHSGLGATFVPSASHHQSGPNLRLLHLVRALPSSGLSFF